MAAKCLILLGASVGTKRALGLDMTRTTDNGRSVQDAIDTMIQFRSLADVLAFAALQAEIKASLGEQAPASTSTATIPAKGGMR